MITAEPAKHGGTIVKAGECILAVITGETGKEATDRFVQLCRDNDEKLTAIGKEVEEKRKWNYANKGRNWPIFTEKEKFIDRLLKQAGIKDS